MHSNSWNYYGCRVTGQILMDTAQAMHDRGLKDAGYVFVNSDDVSLLPREGLMRCRLDAGGCQCARS